MEERFGQYSKRRCLIYLIYMEDTFRNELTRKQASKKKLILFELHRSKQGLIFAQMTIVHVSLIANYN